MACVDGDDESLMEMRMTTKMMQIMQQRVV
jgi:hypothetical protein